jgi:integrase
MTPKKITVAEAVERFLKSKSLRATPHYIETISGFLRPLVEQHGARPLSYLTIDRMEDYILFLKSVDVKFGNHPKRPPVEGKLSKSTLESHHRTLTAFFNWMLKRPEYGVKSNPMVEIPRPRIWDSDVKPKGVSWNTYMRLVEAARNIADPQYRYRNLALIYFLPDTACRAQGVCELRRENLDLTGRTARVIEKFGKPRDVFFITLTRLRLEAWLRVAPKSEYVFCRLRKVDAGQPLTQSGLYQIITDLCKAANIRRDHYVSPHDLRHMFATLADESGINPSHLQQIMGHESPRTTEGYIHRSIHVLQAAHERHSPLNRLKDV